MAFKNVFLESCFVGIVSDTMNRSGKGFLDDEAFRGTWSGVEKGLAEDVETLRGQGGEEPNQGILFPGAFLVAGIGAEHQQAPGKQQRQGLLHSGQGGGQQGGDPVISAGQPTKVEHDQTNGGGDAFSHVLMAQAEEGGTGQEICVC